MQEFIIPPKINCSHCGKQISITQRLYRSICGQIRTIKKTNSSRANILKYHQNKKQIKAKSFAERLTQYHLSKSK